MTWNYNMDEAPKGSVEKVHVTIRGKDVIRERLNREIIIAADDKGKVVTKSYWIEKEERWCMFTKDCPPMCWQPWPTHPTNQKDQGDE